MKTTSLAALLAATLTGAQAAPAVADPAQPDGPVPRMGYRSVFKDTPTGVEGDRTDWKKANAEVGRFPRGHADLLKWEAQNSAPAPVQPPTPQPAASGPARAAPPAHQH